MAVRVSEKVRHNGVLYRPDEVIEDISSKDEKRLVDLGVAVRVPKKRSGGKQANDDEQGKQANDDDKDSEGTGQEQGKQVNDDENAKEPAPPGSE